MVPAALAGRGILIGPRRGKDPLPAPLSARIGILHIERAGQLHPPRVARDVTLMLRADLGEMIESGLFNRSGNIVTRSRSPFPPRTTISFLAKSTSFTRK